MKKLINKIKNDETLQQILFLFTYAILLLWTLISLIITCLNPPTVEDLSVEERIRYEQRILLLP